MTNFAQHIDFIPEGNQSFPDVLGRSQSRYGAFASIIPPGNGVFNLLIINGNLFGSEVDEGYSPHSIWVEAIVTMAIGLTPVSVSSYINQIIESNKILIGGCGRLNNNGFSSYATIMAGPNTSSYTNRPLIITHGNEIQCIFDATISPDPLLNISLKRSTFTEEQEISLLIKGTYLLS